MGSRSYDELERAIVIRRVPGALLLDHFKLVAGLFERRGTHSVLFFLHGRQGLER